MAKPLPDFDLMASLYPGKGWEAKDVKALVGGSLDKGDITNTCIVRISRPLNYLNHRLPPRTNKFPTRVGTDGFNYGLRVVDFWDWMIEVYGKPGVYAKGNISRGAFEKKRGIIGFRKKFKDATGHFSLWNGVELLYDGGRTDYFETSTEAALWVADERRVSVAPY